MPDVCWMLITALDIKHKNFIMFIMDHPSPPPPLYNYTQTLWDRQAYYKQDKVHCSLDTSDLCEHCEIITKEGSTIYSNLGQ